MKILIFQHVPYESPGYILEWIQENGHNPVFIDFYDNTEFPEIEETDALVIMGGPMNIYDDDEYSWLPDERDFIENVIKKRKKILGVCLGSQFIADAMGAKVVKNEHTEVGWFDIHVDEQHLPVKFKGIFPERFKTFHWHGDTFDLPKGIKCFASSEVTPNQAFISGNVAAFQFHMEMTPEGATALVEHNQTLFDEDMPFVQKPGQMLHLYENHEKNRKIMFRFLDTFFED
jgi:GMP synthase-like glutamine amidotransferase